ncbi:FAD-dependent monooxygenase [Microbulbifer elongatus]|uniref:FAD-dependent monooxygenase n=1 Tax=Microbulbifer elongatus TaxID=86173 RepID=A0ABT1P3N6_9GAMM|nr:NAD(P)/FAD-dependent oxidoreductase [Microbulbifer elongatus]MCQ3830724.1 FAD-dependent monooxygenase [Microbulbifer elongatus]
MKTDIAIIGGGLAGLATACGLEAAGRDYRLIEQRPLPVAEGMGIVLHPSGLHALHQLGVDYRHLDGYIPLSEMVFGTPKNPHIAAQAMGYKGYPVASTLRATLHQLLYRHVNKQYCLPERQLITTTRHSEKETHLTLSSGEVVRARNVLFSDGIHGFEATAEKNKATTQGVWRWLIDGVLDQERAYEIHNGKFRLGIFPVSQSCSYIFLTSQPCAFARESKYRNEEIQQILHRFGEPGEFVRNGINADTTIRFDQISENAVRWTNDSGFLQIGDAAHAVTPNLGMGASLAFEDAAVLVQLVQSNPAPILTRELIHSYIKRRHKRVRSIKSYSKMFGVFAHLPGQWLNHAKITGLKYLSEIPLVSNGDAIYKQYFNDMPKQE